MATTPRTKKTTASEKKTESRAGKQPKPVAEEAQPEVKAPATKSVAAKTATTGKPTAAETSAKPAKPDPAQPKATARVTPSVTREQVQVRAYQLFQERGSTHGADLQDWLQAERELFGN